MLSWRGYGELLNGEVSAGHLAGVAGEPTVSEDAYTALALLIAGEPLPVELANSLEGTVEPPRPGGAWDGLRGGEEIPLVEDVLAVLSAAPGSPVPDEEVDKAMRLVAALEARVGISPPVPDPEAVEFDRQLAQLAVMTPTR